VSRAGDLNRARSETATAHARLCDRPILCAAECVLVSATTRSTNRAARAIAVVYSRLASTGTFDSKVWSEPALVIPEASDRPLARPARASGHRPRTSARCASVRESLRSTPAPDPPRQRLDQRERRSARRGAGRRYVGRAPTASGHCHRPAGRDRSIPAVSRAARTSPRARQPPNQRQPGGPLANPHGANHNAQRETGPARRRPPQLQAQTREHPGAAVRHPRPGRPAPRWRAAAQTAAACVVHHRSLYRTRPKKPRLPPTSNQSPQKPVTRSYRRSAPRPTRRLAERRYAATAVTG
jgi:hypothetical protein